ncbi:MAG: ISLre2 family transposase [Spirochaetales bacterium]|nr:ISLre2 family transposase [Spirochaetales bacterium]
MVKSIQYFHEKSIAVFEKLEDEFLRDPSDIASYVTKLTEELHKTGIRMIEETLGYLDEMLNESEVRKLSWVVDRHETKQLITSLGSVNYSKTMFKNKEYGNRSYILDLIMGMDPHERMTEDAEAKLLEEAVQTSYRRGGEETSILDKVSKQTVMKKIHALKFPPEDEAPEEKKMVKELFIDADEDHISLQYRNKKGDLVKNDKGRKNNCMIEKLVYVYEGIEAESPGSKRHKLIQPYYFCSDSASEDNKDFWERIYAYIDSHYDVGQIEKIYVNGDGGTWMEEGKNGMSGVTVTMDEFHLQKYLTKITSHLLDSKWDAISNLRKIIMHKNKKDFNEYVDSIKTYLKETDAKNAESIEEGRAYILNNWMPCKVRLNNRKKIPGCSAEGHVSHVLSSRMSSRPMGWSKRGAGQMGRLRAYYYNGGDMLELVRYQRKELKEAAGYEMTYCTVPEVMKSEKSRHYELGKYMAAIQGSLPSQIKRKLCINHHISGL